MKTIGVVSIILAVIFIVSTAIAIALGPVMIFQGFETANVYQFEKVSSLGINELNVDLLDTELQIYPIKGTDFEFALTGTYAKNEYNNSVELSVEKTGNVLNVAVIYPDWLFLINRNLNLNVGVPEEYYGKLKVEISSGNVNIKNLNTTEFEIISVSGKVEIENIENLGKASVRTSSGNVDIKEFNSEELKIKSVSGEIDCRDIKSAENFGVETSSGNVMIRNLLTEHSEFKTVSGEIDIENSKKINSLRTSSGNIDIKNLEIGNEMNIRTVSGEVDLDFFEGSLIDLEFDSVSGDLENDFGIIVNGKYEINVKTTSGNLRVY